MFRNIYFVKPITCQFFLTYEKLLTVFVMIFYFSCKTTHSWTVTSCFKIIQDYLLNQKQRTKIGSSDTTRAGPYPEIFWGHRFLKWEFSLPTPWLPGGCQGLPFLNLEITLPFPILCYAFEEKKFFFAIIIL